MKPGDYLVAALAAVNFTVAVVYAFSGDWHKTLYWLGATAINTALVLMR